MATPTPLASKELYAACDLNKLAFKTTDELEDLPGFIGQERAVEAVDFGIGIRRQGYDIFALGPTGTGKHTLVRRRLEASAASMPAPRDWCYVNNFGAPDKPKALSLPAGRAARLRSDMDKLIDELRAAIPAAFESDDYRSRRDALEEEFKARQESAFQALQERATEKNLALIRTPQGLALAPMQRGEVIAPQVFQQWPEEHQKKVQADISKLEGELQETMQQIPQWERERSGKLRELNEQVTTFAISHLMTELQRRYAEFPEVVRYLDDVKADLIENAEDFLPHEPQTPFDMLAQSGRRSAAGPPSFRRYQVNVVVDHADSRCAPTVYEDLPKYPNLFGRIEHLAQFGALTTDFNLIKSGALHQANGGYLILDARKLLTQPFVWEELKRVLQSRMLRVQGLYESLGLASTVSLEPEPIPLDVKVVLLGEPYLYYLLTQLDPDFAELFRIAADFDHRVERTEVNTDLYARLIATLARREKLKALDAEAVARVIERAARLCDDRERLTLNLRSISDLLVEAHHWAERNGRDVVSAGDVQQTIDAQIRRLDRIRDLSQEQIHRGTVMVDTEGAVVGQVNALSVIQLGDFAFGKPTRITARVRLGRGQVVDIEREVELGGPLHSKGILILSGYLGEKFAREFPLALSASLVFEQSYGGVDGDSASSTELYALLSALSGVPMKQCFAVTGSINQRGQVQAIGGVNEKIEGFFDVCKARGLTGEHGVLIPAANVKHLMLRSEVIDAAQAGKFHIFPITTIDEGLEVLTGVAAGREGDDGSFPAGSIHQRVHAQLLAFAEKARSFGGSGSVREEQQ